MMTEKSIPEKTVLYLAYGSNMASKTFLGSRGIKPISMINVYVPGLRLTFDLAGVPYKEPCFATTRYRNIPDKNEDTVEGHEKSPLLNQDAGYNDERKRWHKPLIGVVYEITLPDYARMIATESGGRGYKDSVVSCYPFPQSYDPAHEVPEHPDTQPFKAHTLLSLVADDDRDEQHAHTLSLANPPIRPNPTYAQPSPRYLDTITAGAEENNLPYSYCQYLSELHAYRMTSTRQRIGKILFLAIFGPLYQFVLYLTKKYAGPGGISPWWVVLLSKVVHTCMWGCYDLVFKWVFGDGERTVDPDLTEV